MTTKRKHAAAVTVKPKCYIFKCLGCGCLDLAERTDKATCSTACRVRVHREGTVKRLIDECPERVTPADMARANAFDELCPDLIPRVLNGSLRFEDAEARWAVHRAFMALVAEVQHER